MKAIFHTIILILPLHFSITQPTESGKKPQDWDKKVQERFVLLQGDLESKNYQDAKNQAYWILYNYPGLHMDIYLKSIQVYEALADNEKEEKQKRIYQDSVLALYDERLNISKMRQIS